MRTKIEILGAPQVRSFAVRTTVFTDEGEVVSEKVKLCSYQDASFEFEGEPTSEKVQDRYYGSELEAVDFTTIEKADSKDNY